MTNPQPNPHEPSREQVDKIAFEVCIMTPNEMAKWHLTELHRETEKLREQLDKERDVSMCADHAQMWFTARPTFGPDCFLCKHEQIVTTLRAQLEQAEAKARNQLQILEDHNRDTTTTLRYLLEGADAKNNTLLERVKALEYAIEVKDKALTQLKKERPEAMEWTTGQVMIDFALTKEAKG